MTDAMESADHSTATPRFERTYVDADGARWRVYEQAFSTYDRRRGTSLIFASDAAVRRVRAFPAHWGTLSDDALEALSWGA